jgi:hypothetical protein
LLVDTAAARAFVLFSVRGWHLVRMASPALHLPLADSLAYSRAADQLLRPLWWLADAPPADRPERLETLVRWLNGQDGLA